MWDAISKLVGLLPALIRELPERTRPAAAAALIIAAILVVVAPPVIVFVIVLPDGHWVKTVSLAVVALFVLFMAIFAFLLCFGVVERFFRGR